MENRLRHKAEVSCCGTHQRPGRGSTKNRAARLPSFQLSDPAHAFYFRTSHPQQGSDSLGDNAIGHECVNLEKHGGRRQELQDGWVSPDLGPLRLTMLIGSDCIDDTIQYFTAANPSIPVSPGDYSKNLDPLLHLEKLNVRTEEGSLQVSKAIILRQW